MRPFARTTLAEHALLPVGFLVLLWMCVLVLPGLLVDRDLGPGQHLPPAERVKAQNDVRTTLLQGVAGLLLLVGAIATWRQLRLSREGRITERFTKASDQLDYGKSLEARLGAIYALERIARDSERDHWPIMEILTAYVRQHAAWKPQEDQFKLLAPDIQAILTVLGRRARTFEKGKDQRLNLVGMDLRGVMLSVAHLESALLWEVHLEGAGLGKAHLEGALLWEAHLEGATLWEAHLEGADLWKAHLEGADLWKAHLEGADLWKAHLEGVRLEEAHLEGADLRGAIALTKEQIESAITDENTKLPDHLASTRPT